MSLLAGPGPSMRQGNTELVCESSGLAGLYIIGGLTVESFMAANCTAVPR